MSKLWPAVMAAMLTVVSGCGSDDAGAPTIEEPTTARSTSAPSTTRVPTTAPSTTRVPTTAPPTSVPSTTRVPTTAVPTTRVPTSTPTTSATTASSPTPAGVDWDDPTKVVDLGGGFTIAACGGDAPSLCVAKNGTVVGTVDATRYPLASFPFVDRGDDDATTLAKIATDFTDAMRDDRSTGCGAGYGFEPLEVKPFNLATSGGLHYGFVGTNSNGTPSETNLQYATIRGDDLVLITAIAYDEGGCIGRDDLSGFDSRTLTAIRPAIEVVIRKTTPPDWSKT